MKIYTKTGDDGSTGLQGGKRVSKSDLRILAYGAVDEINSCLGITLANGADSDVAELLTRIQNELFVAGSDLSNPDLSNTKTRITESMIESMEKSIDRFEEELTPLANFILPGGNKAAAYLHLARTVTRRAETLVVALSEQERINPICQRYLNRLSDLLFVLARVANRRDGTGDVVWKQDI
ncbi:cob(I)yrinic acid a,c-diamide adenosyltransferase [Candidatus Nitrosotenuis cloacae]|uniref:cob(I)yrinic acid a,c-diamide adenosyltransferase n=1 Tax=Candidatus Nitrosotenuis cloacae TaxID=1603555 RepID=UPI0022811E30|nr:cob(I)yrinic acid a,c-diamide adenosyltransferase [Candidatus Nitrosotenuis cloacae]